jgi:prevent-host-death family protein
MKTAAVSQLKATLSKYLERVKAGEEVLITDRGKPIARIIPISLESQHVPPHLRDMERAGLARIGTGKLPKGFWDAPRPQDAAGAARKALLEERSEGR